MWRCPFRKPTCRTSSNRLVFPQASDSSTILSINLSGIMIRMARRRTRVTVTCRQCKKTFTAKPSHIAMGFGKFCSRLCSSLSQKTGKEVSCDICNKKVYRIPKYLVGSKSGKYFCTKSCQTLWRNQLYVGERHANWKHGRAAYRSVLGRAKRERVCEICNTDDRRILTVHHKDRNRTNNNLDNLAWLCHNCHFLVHRYDVGRDRGLLRPRS